MSSRMLYKAVYCIHERALRYREMAVTCRRVLLAHGPIDQHSASSAFGSCAGDASMLRLNRRNLAA
jgi:hypothetical protein